jgi:cephalosporin hydroxylase
MIFINMFTYYNNIKMQQSENTLFVFHDFLIQNKFDIIIEIGTSYGAFTRFLKDTSPTSDVYSYDIMDKKPKTLDTSGINFMIKNIFDESCTEVIDFTALSLLNSNSRKLVLCDAWNKVNHFKCVAKYLKQNDMIMVHDYAETSEYFRNYIMGRVWDWCEVTESDISDVSQQYNLNHYNQDEFKNIVWLCKIKTS